MASDMRRSLKFAGLAWIAGMVALSPGSATESTEPTGPTLRSFSTLGVLDKEEIWVATSLREGTPPFPKPSLQRYQTGNTKLSPEILLDREVFEGREVQGIFRLVTPEGKPALGVISQWQVEQGDEPLVHAIEETKLVSNQKADWVQLAVAPCVDVVQLEPQGSAVVFHCGPDYELNPKTRKVRAIPAKAATRKPVPLAVKGWRFAPMSKKRVAVPLKNARLTRVRAEISGPAFNPNRFRVYPLGVDGKPLFELVHPLQ